MARGNAKTIQEAIAAMMSKYGLAERYRKVSVLASWEKLMGKTIASRTERVYIRERKLYIRLTSAALRQELSYAKDKILHLVNQEAGQVIVDEVIIQ